MRFIVNNRQEPNGCLFLLFYGLRAVSISMGYIVMEEDNFWWRRHGPWCQAGGMMEIIPRRTRWRSNVRRTISYHIIHACDVYPFICILFCLVTIVIAAVAL